MRSPSKRLIGALFLSVWMMPGVVRAGHHEGVVEPIHDVLLGFPVPGRVARLHQEEGARAESGGALMELDARAEELEQARRRLIFEDQTELEAARAREALLEEDVAALRQLFERTGSVSREELNQKELEHRLSGIAVERLIIAKERERVEYEMSEVYLSQRRIVAPFDGVVAEVLLQEGESASANQPVIRFVDDSVCFLTLHIPSRIAAQVHVGQSARVRFAEGDEVEKVGHVAFIAPVADPASGLRRVRIEFVNDAPKVIPGTLGVWIPAGTFDE